MVLKSVESRAPSGGPILDQTEEEVIELVQPEVDIVLGDSSAQGPGTLYVTTKQIIWLSDHDLGKGYAVDFLSLTMHAISRDNEAYPVPCIYTQIAGDEDEYEASEEDEHIESEEDAAQDLSRVFEMRLVPKDASLLDNLFRVLCNCAALNPDPVVEQEGEGEWFFNEEEIQAGFIGQNGTEGNISELHAFDPRFEDAEDFIDEDL